MQLAGAMRGRTAGGVGATLTVEMAYRLLLLGIIRQAVRDLSDPTWRHDASYWLAHEGREWAMMVDLDTTSITSIAKGKVNEKKRRSRYRRRRSNGRSSDSIS